MMFECAQDETSDAGGLSDLTAGLGDKQRQEKMMTERYWEPGDAPGGDPLKDWVSENVVSALAQLIEDGGAWIGVTDGKLTVTFHSFEMPEKEGEPSDIWHKDFDLLEMAMDWAGDYDGLQQLSDAQREDLEERARLLDELAAKFRARAGLSPNAK